MNLIYNLLVYVVWFPATYYLIYFMLSLLVYRDRISENLKADYHPAVSIIVPAYNEEKCIAETINSLKSIDYDDIGFLVISDGSCDSTPEIVKREIAGDSRFKFIARKENIGKAGTLNEGISKVKGEIICCMDADSVIERDAIDKALPYFKEEGVGAVTVSVDVFKPKGLLHRIFAVEFALGLSLFLKVFSFLDSIFVTPGPFSMYKKDVLEKLGGFDTNNVTEDHEIAFRLHKSGYKIRNCLEAKVYTKLPQKFKGIYRQRKRWYYGAIQTFFQHRNMLLRKKYGFFSLFIPFNFFLILTGLILFFSSTYLLLSNLSDKLTYFSYTGFNFLNHLSFDIDFLAFGRINMLVAVMLLSTVFLMFTGLKFTSKRYKDHKLGMLGYPLMFFLYQIFWFGAFLSVFTRKRIKWK